jgi:hypothetical protein
VAADFDNPDGEHIVLNGINDTIISLPNSISLLAGVDDAPEVLFGNRVRVLVDSSVAFL